MLLKTEFICLLAASQFVSSYLSLGAACCIDIQGLQPTSSLLLHGSRRCWRHCTPKRR